MGTFSWLTSDTEESISPRDNRPVYLLRPGGQPPICEPAYEGYGDFGGVDAYIWVARNNLPEERIVQLDDEKLRTVGLAFALGRYYVDAATGAKLSIFHGGHELIDPEIQHHPITYAQPVPGYDRKSANELIDAGHLIPTAHELRFPLKFSFNPNVRYEDLPAAKDCPDQGFPARPFNMTRSSPCHVEVTYGEAHPFWDVSFTPLQRAYAEVTSEEVTGISVMIDAEDGSLSLNNGYAEGSPQCQDEQSLFENMQLAIVEALTQELPDDNPAYTVFLNDAGQYAEDRHDGLVDLEQQLSETRDALADA